MLITLAWKNIWRNKKRSGVIILAIILGLWAGLISGGMMVGMGESMVNTAIDRDLAHLQLHAPGFTDEKEINNYLPEADSLLFLLPEIEGVKTVSGRTVIEAMVSSASSSYGVTVHGINPEAEKKVTVVAQKIIEGTYLTESGKNEVIIGRKLAERLGVKLRSKVVLTFQDFNGDLVYAAPRIAGIFKTESTLFDESEIFIGDTKLAGLLGKKVIHEIAVKLRSASDLALVSGRIKKAAGKEEVKTWEQLAPELAFINSSMHTFSKLFVAIILLALIFGITNTMLMAVVDRTKEFGVLIAVGMKKGKVFALILWETVFLSVTGALLGVVAGVITITYLGKNGLDLSIVSASLGSFGASTTIYPELPPVFYFSVALMVLLAANLAAIIPAIKAVRLKPARAIGNY